MESKKLQIQVDLDANDFNGPIVGHRLLLCPATNEAEYV